MSGVQGKQTDSSENITFPQVLWQAVKTRTNERNIISRNENRYVVYWDVFQNRYSPIRLNIFSGETHFLSVVELFFSFFTEISLRDPNRTVLYHYFLNGEPSNGNLIRT